MAQLTTMQRCLYNAIKEFEKSEPLHEDSIPVTEESFLEDMDDPIAQTFFKAMEAYGRIKWEEACIAQKDIDGLQDLHAHIPLAPFKP